MNEGFVAVEHAVAPREQVAFQPAFALMLAEHFHHAPLGSEQVVARAQLTHPLPVGLLEHGRELIGHGLVRAKQAKVAALVVERDHVAQEAADHGGVALAHRARRRDSRPRSR